MLPRTYVAEARIVSQLGIEQIPAGVYPNLSQNYETWLISLPPDEIGRVTILYEGVTRHTAPGRQILMGPIIPGHHLKDLSRFDGSQPHAEFQYQIPARHVSSIPFRIKA